MCRLSRAAERDENTCREEMAISELVAPAEAIEMHEAAAAKERQREHGGTSPVKSKGTCEDSAQVIGEKTRDKVAAAVGLSHDTLSKAKEVVQGSKDRSLPTEVRDPTCSALLPAGVRQHWRNRERVRQTPYVR